MSEIKRLTINQAPEEYEALRDAATSKGITITDYIKKSAALLRIVQEVSAETGLITGVNEAGEEFPIIVDALKYAETHKAHVIS